MISFKQFLTEQAERTVAISAEEAIKLLKANCMGHLRGIKNDNDKIYRGGSSSSDQEKTIRLGDSNIGKPRRSANTFNYYTLWMDNHPDWEGFPKRSRSFICSEDYGIADMFGDPHWVVPYDNALIGVVPADDLWAAFDLPIAADLSDFMNRVNSALGELGDDRPSTYAQLVKALFLITKDVLEDHPHKYADLIDVMNEYGLNDLFDVFRKVITPKEFKYFKASEYRNSHKDRELFIQGKAIFIPITFKSSEERSQLKDFFDDFGIW